MNGDEGMDKRVEHENTNDKISKTQELIIEMVRDINNLEPLIKIYSFVKVIFEMEK